MLKPAPKTSKQINRIIWYNIFKFSIIVVISLFWYEWTHGVWGHWNKPFHAHIALPNLFGPRHHSPLIKCQPKERWMTYSRFLFFYKYIFCVSHWWAVWADCFFFYLPFSARELVFNDLHSIILPLTMR